MNFFHSVFAFLLAVASYADGAENGLSDLVSHAPLVKPQADGVVYLNVEAGALVSLETYSHPLLINKEGGVLKVFIDGRPWYPTPALHSLNVWNVALQQGLHSSAVTYVDYRWKNFHDDYWMPWQAEEMWQGTPKLEISGANLSRRPIPASCFVREPQAQAAL